MKNYHNGILILTLNDTKLLIDFKRKTKFERPNLNNRNILFCLLKNIKFNFFEFQDFLSFDFILIIENQTFCYENRCGILFEIMINTKSSFFS